MIHKRIGPKVSLLQDISPTVLLKQWGILWLWMVGVGLGTGCRSLPFHESRSIPTLDDYRESWNRTIEEGVHGVDAEDPFDSLFSELTWEEIYEEALRSPFQGEIPWTGPSFLDVPSHQRAKIQKIVQFTIRRRYAYLQRIVERGRPYYGYIVDRLLEEGLPVELVYLPIIESAYNPRARSRANAVGLWQFIASTGRKYGLRVDWWVDERLDPYYSTDAALRYLKALYEEFGRWDLAIAAYNVGEGKIRRALRRGGTSFWDIYQRLPRETRMYVPLFVAMYEIFQIHKDSLGLEDPLVLGLQGSPPQFDYVQLHKPTTLRKLAQWAGVEEREFLRLNPWMRRKALPPNPQNLRIRLPQGTASAFLATLQRDPDSQKWQTFERHEVRRGETLSHIARRYGTTVSALMRMNGIRNPRQLRPRQILLVPPPPVSGAYARARPSKPKRRPSLPEGSYFLYEIRRGDTLYDIARTFGVSVRELMRINAIDSPRRLRPGMKIRVPVQTSN